jgi:hypothetical protein
VDINLWKSLSYYFGINCTTHRSNFASYNLELFILECNIYFQDRFTNVYLLFHIKLISGTDDRMKVENNFNLESSKSEKIVQTSLLAQNLQYVSLKS